MSPVRVVMLVVAGTAGVVLVCQGYRDAQSRGERLLLAGLVVAAVPVTVLLLRRSRVTPGPGRPKLSVPPVPDAVVIPLRPRTAAAA